MKPFYRNNVTIGIFLTVMLTIVGTASAHANYTVSGPSVVNIDSSLGEIDSNVDGMYRMYPDEEALVANDPNVVVVTPAESPSSIYMSINAGELANNTI